LICYALIRFISLDIFRIPTMLVALVPRPRFNLTRFHGVFAPNFKHRKRIVPRRPRGRVDDDKPRAPLSWMQRLNRVFAIDIETCPECGGMLRVAAPAHPCARGISASMHVIASIEGSGLIPNILAHLRAREALLCSGARAPPEPG
jgi:hypothetical protein